jgi:hypothetical protein
MAPAALNQRLLFFKISSLETGADRPRMIARLQPQLGQNEWRLPQTRADKTD